ncbi:MAG: E3 binding domain-containing protein, partial [Deltaproteobacteria bacterium]|nr:E3 binding domain-containing protein [Deltaproteobacteria bacterium]
MKAEIRVPSVGESILEGILVDWLAEDRATVAAGAPLFELETDKVTLTVEAEQAGRLTRGASAGATVAVGAVVGWIETEAGAGAPRQTADGNGPVASPAARAILAEHRLDPAAVPGTGKGGRITREDAVAAVAAAIPAAPG